MKTKSTLRNFLALAGSSLLAMSSANAATLTWDADTGTSGAQDGGGNWTSGGTTFWDGAANVATTNNITTDIAQFGNGGTLASQATVNVSTQSINGLIFGATTTSGYNLTASSPGQTLTLGASGITVNSGAQTTNVGSANLGITLGAGQTWANSSSSLLTVNSNINLNGQTLTWGANQHISGNITGAGTLDITNLTTRRILSGTNSFTSNLQIRSAGSSAVGILAVTSILDSTADSSLGKNNTITLGAGTASAGRLEYIGTATSSSNRTFIMGGTGNASAQIHNNGTGVLTFTATTFVSPTATGTRSLILGGSNTGDNVIQGGVNNGSGVVNLSKTGTGTWILSGTNTYTGTTTVSGGKLVLSGANTPGASTTTLSGGGELVLDYTSQNNAKIGTGALSLSGGTVTLTAGSHAQTVASTSLGGAGTFITRTSGTSSLNLGAFTSITRGSSLSISADNVATSNRTNTNGILGGNFVVGNNWAVNSTNLAGGAIVGLSTYTALPTSGFSDTTNYSLTGSLTLAGTGTVNSLKIIASADGQTLDINTRNLLVTNIGNSAGYLFTANDDSYTYNITGTAIMRTALANQDTFFFVNNGTLNMTADTGSGTGSVIKAGSGTLILGGDSSVGANWGGSLAVQQGTLRLTHNNGAGTTGGGITVQNLAALELGNSVAIGAEILTITGTGVANGGALRNHSGSNTYGGAITIGVDGARINSNVSTSLELTGGIVTAADRNVTFGGAGNTTVSTTAITGAGGVIKDGLGTSTLSAGVTHSYTGTTTVSGAGKLIVNGNISTSILTTVQTGATLGGTGTVGALTVDSGGFHTPGNSPGIQNTGNYTNAGTLGIEMNSLTVGTGYDQVNTTGTVSLSGMLTVTMGFTAAANSLFFILANDDTDAITGTFSNAAINGNTYTLGGQQFQISYFGNQTSPGVGTFTGGNDVVLMAIPEPRAALLGAIGLIALLRRRRD